MLGVRSCVNILVVLALAAILGISLSAPVTATPVNTTKQLYNVSILSDPVEAAVFIDGVFYGVTPVTVQLMPGSYLLELIWKGHGKWTTQFVVPGTEVIKATMVSNAEKSNNDQNEKIGFRVGPALKVTYQRTTINSTNPGVVSFYFANPEVNDCILRGDVYISLPDGVYIDGEGWLMVDYDTGIAHGKFEVSPGGNTLHTVKVYAEKPGVYYLNGYIIYYPNNDKDDYHIIHISKRFVCPPPPTPTPKIEEHTQDTQQTSTEAKEDNYEDKPSNNPNNWLEWTQGLNLVIVFSLTLVGILALLVVARSGVIIFGRRR
jgi:hypothetical protein